jgi:hypothetical protein
MNPGRCFATVLLLSVPCAAPLSAQWIHYPSGGVPRTSDGKANLSANAPRTSDNHPDLSGIWDIEHNRACPPEGCNDMLIGQEFMNIGWSLKGGLPYQPSARDAVKSRGATSGQDDPITHCLPGGIVKMWTDPLLKKIVQTPGLVAMLSERNASYRQIFIDGRPLPQDPQPSWNGYSTAKWDGDTLVVESNGFRDGIWLDRSGSPLTEGARITEKLRRVNYGKLEIELTVNDPKAYTAPWTVKLNHFLMPDTDLLDYVCLENEQDLQHFSKSR